MIFNCLESCYWHLIEKRFCYDENIALYEEPVKKEEKPATTFENMAFYDQVRLIAGRAIVTIDTLPKQTKPIEFQPVRRIRWWEDNVDQQNKENEAKNKHKQPFVINTSSVPTILENSNEDLTSSTEELDSIINKQVSIEVPQVESEGNNQTISSKENLTDKNTDQKPNTLYLDESVTLRKRSLRDRRMSRSLTISIDRHLELPIIRQISMPKFYIDTPEINQTDSCIASGQSATLMSPVVPRNQFDFFDLRSVVQLEKEHRVSTTQQNPVPVHKQINPNSRLSLIKDKLKHNKLKKQASTTSLPHSIQHI